MAQWVATWVPFADKWERYAFEWSQAGLSRRKKRWVRIWIGVRP